MTKNEKRLAEIRARIRAGTATREDDREYKRLKFQEVLAASHKILG